jgi:glutathione-regulated potassium-efflux system ancillary protein KefG
MARVLVLFAHPALEKSRVHRVLTTAVPDLPDLTFHDLYEAYPGFDIDVEREQKLLEQHETIVMQHPFFWYSTPALVKEWEDLVLEHGWAYGSAGTALHGKRMLHVMTSGGDREAYCPQGYNQFTYRQFLAPLEQTARLCGMHWTPPYVISGTHRLSADDIRDAAVRYGDLLRQLHGDELDLDAAGAFETLNDALPAIRREKKT